MILKKATVRDVKPIHALINRFAKKEDMLPRSLNEIYENVRDYYVCEDDGEVVAVSALHILWDDLAEIRSVAVSKKYRGKNVGKRLIRLCLKEAKQLGIKKVFALTYYPGYFKTMGFEETDKNELPQKIWGDCLRCHKFPDCDESAVITHLP